MPQWNYGNNPFYDFNSWYGAGQNWWNTPFVRNDLSTQPGMERGVYERFLTENGLGGMTNKDQFARGQFGRMEDAFKAAMLSNPSLNRIDFYKQNFDRNALDRAFASLAPSQRGQFNPAQTRTIRFT